MSVNEYIVEVKFKYGRYGVLCDITIKCESIGKSIEFIMNYFSNNLKKGNPQSNETFLQTLYCEGDVIIKDLISLMEPEYLNEIVVAIVDNLFDFTGCIFQNLHCIHLKNGSSIQNFDVFGDISGLQKLKFIKLYEGRILDREIIIGSKFRGITELWLNGCEDNELTDRTFQEMYGSKLSFVVLRRFNFEVLDADIFRGLNLKRLCIRNCEDLKEFNGMFNQYPNLKELYISKTMITSFDAFENMESLREIYIKTDDYNDVIIQNLAKFMTGNGSITSISIHRRFYH